MYAIAAVGRSDVLRRFSRYVHALSREAGLITKRAAGPSLTRQAVTDGHPNGLTPRLSGQLPATATRSMKFGFAH
jgi:hypothetical protein